MGIVIAAGFNSAWWNVPTGIITFLFFLQIIRRYRPVGGLRALSVYIVSHALTIVVSALFAVVIVLPIRYFVASPFQVSGDSMLPTYRAGDLLLIDKMALRSRVPERDDAVILIAPTQPRQYYLKRIIGLPGEEVQIAGGRVTIFNAEHPAGYLLSESYLLAQAVTEAPTPGRVSVPPGSYFVLGDNREYSNDSRYWGMVPAQNLVGVVATRIWPTT